MYDPTTARFLSKDPLEERGGTPNFYLYCANDPVNHTDPSGNSPCGRFVPDHLCPGLAQQVAGRLEQGAAALQQQVTGVVDQAQTAAAPYVQVVRNEIAGAVQQGDRLGGQVVGAVQQAAPRVSAVAETIGSVWRQSTAAGQLYTASGGPALSDLTGLISKVGRCAADLKQEADKVALNILAWGYKSVGDLVNQPRPQRSENWVAGALGVWGGAHSLQPSYPIRQIASLFGRDCVKMLPGYQSVFATPLSSLDNWLWALDMAWWIATDQPKPGATLLKWIKESPRVQWLKDKLPGAGKALGKLAKEAAWHGLGSAAINAVYALKDEVGGQHPLVDDVIEGLQVAAQFVPDWKLGADFRDTYGDVLDDLFDYGGQALADMGTQLVDFVTGGVWWEELEATIGEQLWPWGPPFHDHGIVNDLEGKVVPLTNQAASALWDSALEVLRCPASGLLDALGRNQQTANQHVRGVLDAASQAWSKLGLWVWVAGQIAGSPAPGSGNAAAGTVTAALNTGSQVASAVLELHDLAEKVNKLFALLDRMDDEDEDAVDVLEDAVADQVDAWAATGLELRAGEEEQLAERLAAQFGEGYRSESWAGESVEELLLGIARHSLVAGATVVGAFLGGAARGFAGRLREKLKKIAALTRKKRSRRLGGKYKKRKEKRQTCGCDTCAERGSKNKGARQQCLQQKCPKCGKACPVNRGGGAGNCFGAGTPVWLGDGTAGPVERVPVGAWVPTWAAGEPGLGAPTEAPDMVLDRSGLRLVTLVQERAGERTEARLLRPAGWLAGLGAAGAGDRVHLDLPELGATGAFRVLAVEPCPAIGPKPAAGGGRVRLVTGAFRHSRGRTLGLWVEGGSGAVRVTGRHPVWSADRLDWVPVNRLRPGERVQVRGRAAVVRRIGEAGDEPVFNLEVDADHCYRVGEQGILVHNASFVQSKNQDPCATCTTPVPDLGEPVQGVAGHWYRASVQRGNYRQQHPICRINWIQGPIHDVRPPGSGIRRGAGLAQRRMNTFFFTGSGAEQKAARSNYDAGHLIADSFGGPDDERNLVPMVRGLNRLGDRAWYVMEGHIRDCLRHAGSDAHGWMEVRLTYGNTGWFVRYIPTRFDGIFRLSSRFGTKVFPFTFDNQTGVLTTDFGPCYQPGSITGPANPGFGDTYPIAPGQ